MGAALTANRIAHPSIPDYPIAGVPRDPGITWAYNTGIGLASVTPHTTFAVNLVYEPIWSHTWGTAAGDTVTAGGAPVAAGATTIDNRFRFSNFHIALGLARETTLESDTTIRLGMQLGCGCTTSATICVNAIS